LEAERERRRRLEALERRGDAVWADVETAVELRNASGYDRAAALLADLQAVARDAGEMAAFERRIQGIRDRHARKARFLERLTFLGL
jgi:purine nucleoside permease